MLIALHRFIKKEGVVSTQQLIREFAIDEQALKPMLALWLKKGCIIKCRQPLNCGSSCSGCKTAVEYYQCSDDD